MALPSAGAVGADIGASESLSRPALLARLSGPNRTPVMRCVGDPRQKGDVSAMEAKTPARRALAVLDTPPPAEPIGKALRITVRVRRAVDLMVSGQCKKITEAAAAVGLHHDSLCRALGKPHVAEHMRQKVIKRLNLAAARAGDTKIELLDCADNMVRDRASTFVLGLASIAPAVAPSLSVNIEMKAGYVIDLSDEPRLPRILP